MTIQRYFSAHDDMTTDDDGNIIKINDIISFLKNRKESLENLQEEYKTDNYLYNNFCGKMEMINEILEELTKG